MKASITSILIFIATAVVAQNPLNEFYKGMEDGNYKYYYNNGQLRLEFTIKNGYLDKEHIDYFRNGNKKSIERYENGRFNGQNISYTKNGEIRTDEFYINDTVIYYKEYSYYKSGQLKSERIAAFMEDSLSINPFVELKEHQLRRVIVYNADKSLTGLPSVGVYREYYDNGQLKIEEPLINNKRNGTCHTYFKNGQVYYQYECVDDLLHGECKMYNKKGDLKKTAIWMKGKKTATH